MRKNFQWRQVAAWVLACLVLSQASALAKEEGKRNMGLSGTVKVVMNRPDYQMLKQSDGAPLLVQLEGVNRLPNGKYEYCLHYMGLESGRYRLSEWLETPTGETVVAEDEWVEIRDGLEAGHDGVLAALEGQKMPWMGSYRAILVGLFLLWVGMLVVILRVYRKKRELVVEEEAVEEISIIERLEPLVVLAASGKMNVDEQTELERLMMRYWRDALGLEGMNVPAALAAIKDHAEAGRLIRAVEKWLHSQQGCSEQEICELLEIYRRSSQKPESEEGSR